MNPAPLPISSQRSSPWLRRGVLAALVLATIVGAGRLAFLCDDAFITFRYVGNAHDGLGLVWNPPPFQPVEGYTGFLWALLLWATWSWFGVEPPAAANVLSIACGVLQVLVVAAAARRLCARDGSRLPDAVGLLAVAAIVGNRTFLQWLTSGLETALFNLAFVGWVLLAFRSHERRGTRWLAAWATAAAIAALTRPDGLLLVAATAAAGMLLTWRGERRIVMRLLGLAPLVTVALHVGWRRATYGEWLPNTYYAKIVAAWPEAGVRYLACFVLEHGSWVLLPLMLVWLVVMARRIRSLTVAALLRQLPAIAAVAATGFHTAYYILKVGGDHFEYRVLSHLVPLGVLATAALAGQLANGMRLPLAAITAIWIASGFGWLHYALTRDMPTHGFRRIAPDVPAVLQPLAQWFDRQQAWLLFRNIGLRCDHHRRLLERFRAPFPHRMWIPVRPDPFPVFATGAVGCPGWFLPDTAILDMHGLNDWVVARTPVFPISGRITREALQPVFAQADTDHDGRLAAAEFRAALGLFSGSRPEGESSDFLVDILMTMHAVERSDSLTLAEADGIAESLTGARSMAHEHHPPPGYVDAFEPNVSAQDGVATARPRKVPLTAERVRALEAEWRAKVTAARAR